MDRRANLGTGLRIGFSVDPGLRVPGYYSSCCGSCHRRVHIPRRPREENLAAHDSGLHPVESYGSGTVSNGKPRISCDLKVNVRGEHVILVEDIVDTGNTLSCLIDYLKSKGVSSISVCTLLDKPARRKVHFQLVGEGKYSCGFECPDYFVVGYGFDFDEQYRNLPYVGVLKPEIY